MKGHGDPYALKDNPVVDLKDNCEGDPHTVNCDDACQSILDGEPTSEFCFKLPRKESGTLLQCWITAKMGCWDQRGGVPVFAGDVSYTLQKHFITDSWAKVNTMSKQGTEWVKKSHWTKSPTMRVMHLSSDVREIIIFGIGSTNPIDSICELVYENQELIKIMETFRPEKSILIGGHSEGSRWAACFNALINSKGLKNERYVIGTGSVVASQHFLDKFMTDYSRENSLNLVLGIEYPLNGPVNPGVLADVYSLSKIGEGVTFPQFGYHCDMKAINCLIKDVKQQPFDLDESLQKVQSNMGLEEILLDEVHAFHRYRSCFWTCSARFNTLEGFNYESNIPPLQIMQVEEGSSSSFSNPKLALVPYVDFAHAGYAPASDPGPIPSFGTLRIRHPIAPFEDLEAQYSPNLEGGDLATPSEAGPSEERSMLPASRSVLKLDQYNEEHPQESVRPPSPGFENEDIRSYPWLDWAFRRI